VIGNSWQKKYIEGSNTVTNQEVLRDSTIKLIEMTSILMKHHLDERDKINLRKLTKEYREVLQMGWPNHTSKSNLHLTQHYPEVIERFGPPIATAAWAQERLNGILGNIPNNQHLGMLHFRYFVSSPCLHQKSNLTHQQERCME
jgi:hypothetical protein